MGQLQNLLYIKQVNNLYIKEKTINNERRIRIITNKITKANKENQIGSLINKSYTYQSLKKTKLVFLTLIIQIKIIKG